MTHNKRSRERLDVLLAGLEEEVLQSDLAELRSEAAGTAHEAVRAMRSNMESLIRAADGSSQRRRESPYSEEERAKGVSARVAQMLERVGHWAGIAQSSRAPDVLAPVRMAFSGEQPDKTEKTAYKTKHRKPSESGGTKDGDC